MSQTRKWSAEVTEHSDALDLEPHVFEQDDPKKIAASLKRSADKSHKRKAEPFRSAMSMLTFYITAPARICRKNASRCWKRPKVNCARPMASRTTLDARNWQGRNPMKIQLDENGKWFMSGNPEQPSDPPEIPEKEPEGIPVEPPETIPQPDKGPFSPDEPEQVPPLPLPEHPSPGPTSPGQPTMVWG